MTTNWKEEFETLLIQTGYKDWTSFDEVPAQVQIKNFITTLLEKQREEYVEIVKKYQNKHDYSCDTREVCNDIINLIKNK